MKIIITGDVLICDETGGTVIAEDMHQAEFILPDGDEMDTPRLLHLIKATPFDIIRSITTTKEDTE